MNKEFVIFKLYLRRTEQAKRTRRIWQGLFVLKTQPSQQSRSPRIYPDYWVSDQDKLRLAGDVSENDRANKKENRGNMSANQAQRLKPRLQFAPVDVTHIGFFVLLLHEKPFPLKDDRRRQKEPVNRSCSLNSSGDLLLTGAPHPDNNATKFFSFIVWKSI